jgi:hypothetical protein
MKTGQLIAVNGGIYEYGEVVAADYTKELKLHRVYVVDIDEEGILTSVGSTWYFTSEELTNGFNKINLTEAQWHGIVEGIIRRDYAISDEEINEATDDIIYRCFALNKPQFDELEEYIACYMKR